MNRELQVFSGSSVQTFMRCQRQWEFAYVYELKRPPSVRMILGTAVDVFSDAFDSAVIEAEPDPEDKESPGQAKDSGIATLSVYHETVAPPIEPLFVEHEGLVHVNDIPYSYTIDLVDTKGRVRDHKYTKRRPQSSADYRLSMIGYALGYREETGKKEADVVLDYMVRTKDPYHWPVASSGPVPDAAINSFANILELVNAAVMEGRFLPTGLTNHACSWCGYNDICPDYTSM
jgi:CRISPR/Cas system-associated exonuclease Cas4 (RecB family)